MLNYLRRHAGNWLIKTALAMIIGAFALFFGYTRFQSRTLKGERLVAMVGEAPITRERFQAVYEDSLERMRESLKGDVPENLQTFLKNQLTVQLIAEEVAALYARSLGFEVSDEAIAKTIRENPSFAENGAFEPERYRRYRLFYRHRYGEDLEERLRGDLLRDRLERLGQVCFGPWQKELKTSPSLLIRPWMDRFRGGIKIELYAPRRG